MLSVPAILHPSDTAWVAFRPRSATCPSALNRLQAEGPDLRGALLWAAGDDGSFEVTCVGHHMSYLNMVIAERLAGTLAAARRWARPPPVRRRRSLAYGDRFGRRLAPP